MDDLNPIGAIITVNNLADDKTLKNYRICDGSLIDTEYLDLDLIQSLKHHTSPEEIASGKLRVPNLSTNAKDALRYYIKVKKEKPNSVKFILGEESDG